MEKVNKHKKNKETKLNSEIANKTVHYHKPSNNYPSLVNSILGESGYYLDENTIEFMKNTLGYDFSNVKIYKGGGAARSAQSLNALAYNVGNEIVFGEGHYRPNTTQGRKLIAHELTHIVQQQSIRPHLNPSSIIRGRYHGATKVFRNGDPDKIPKITREELYKDLSEEKWRESLLSAQNYAKQGKTDKAAAEMAVQIYRNLYQNIVSLAGVGKVLRNTTPINWVKSENVEDEIQSGLNFSLGDKSGGTTYLMTTGRGTKPKKVGEPLKTTKKSDGPQQEVAIILYKNAFNIQKEITLGIMRHEIAHAKHHMDALDLVQKFRDPKVKATNFKSWLKKQQNIDKVGRILVEEDMSGAKSVTESLAYVEGFMNMFHLIDLQKSSIENIKFAFSELTQIINNLYWKNLENKPLVKNLIMNRLQAYYCKTLDMAHQKKFKEQLAVAKANPHWPDKTSANDFLNRLQNIIINCNID